VRLFPLRRTDYLSLCVSARSIHRRIIIINANYLHIRTHAAWRRLLPRMRHRRFVVIIIADVGIQAGLCVGAHETREEERSNGVSSDTLTQRQPSVCVCVLQALSLYLRAQVRQQGLT
jgi:hypothetical protein